jgi:dihydroorotase
MPFDIRMPDDFHAHLRQDDLLPPVVRDTAPWFGRVLAMPNTVPPVQDRNSLEHYRSQIMAAMPPECRFEPLLVFKVLPQITAQEVARMAAAGAVGGKLYPQGVTTNSSDGASDVESLYPVFEAMEAHGLVLEIHAEMPGAFVLDREERYLAVVDAVVNRFPTLRIVVEHVSSAAAVRYVVSAPERVAATVTVHHLLLTLDDVIGGELKPHHFCKPIAKRESDRQALLDVLTQGHPSFFFGSDSAPHRIGDKECESGCAGIYTAPVAVPLLVELAESLGLPVTEAEEPVGPSLEAFLSRYGAQFYQLPLQVRRLQIVEKPWTVPARYADVVPFAAGRELRYAALPETGEKDEYS